MKVVKQRKPLRFCDIKYGDVFMFEVGSRLYVKVEQVRTMPHGDSVNVMLVETGRLDYARDDAVVISIDCELVVK